MKGSAHSLGRFVGKSVFLPSKQCLGTVRTIRLIELDNENGDTTHIMSL